jgi:hypothetical protein
METSSTMTRQEFPDISDPVGCFIPGGIKKAGRSRPSINIGHDDADAAPAANEIAKKKKRAKARFSYSQR